MDPDPLIETVAAPRCHLLTASMLVRQLKEDADAPNSLCRCDLST